MEHASAISRDIQEEHFTEAVKKINAIIPQLTEKIERPLVDLLTELVKNKSKAAKLQQVFDNRNTDVNFNFFLLLKPEQLEIISEKLKKFLNDSFVGEEATKRAEEVVDLLQSFAP